MNNKRLLEALAWRNSGKAATNAYDLIVKQGYSPVLHNIAKLINLVPGTIAGIPNSPGPLTSMLTGGLLGAGAGYLGGAAGETLLPINWRRGKLRRSMALTGALAGMMPGTLAGLANLSGDKDFSDSSILRTDVAPPNDEPFQGLRRINETPVNPKFANDMDNYQSDNTGALSAPSFDVDQFNNVIWQDPHVYSRLDTKTQAAASGIVTGAAHINGTGTRFITPMDVARVTAGMGSGYLSGMIIGKGLGLLMGMPPETQERLRQTGAFAGVVANLIPLAFSA